jgi:transcriptional regulator with XRE-family HTH domain
MKNEEAQTFAKHFGEFVRNGRIGKKVSQNDLAEALGINQSYLSRIEQGARNIDLELAVKICSYLGLNLNDFLISKCMCSDQD